MSEVKPFAFVLMPFSPDFDDIYKFGIKAACADVGIIAERVDEQFYSELMLERIYRQIENADLIIADMTGKNPNVFYEVGYVHAKRKPCALITQKSADIPFDLQHHFHIIYDGKIDSLRQQLMPRLDWMKAELERARNEVLSVSFTPGSGDLKTNDFFHEGEFVLKVVLKNPTKNRSPEIDNLSITTSDTWRLFVDGSECVSEAQDKGTKKHFVTQRTNRLAPGALSLTEIKFKRTFWSKWKGEEKRDKYNATGRIGLEIATAEGILQHSFDLDVEFTEFPF